MNGQNTMEDVRMEKVLLSEVRELALELCLGGEIEQRLKCIREALLWDNEELTKYFVNALPDPEKKYYLRNTELYNAMFRTALRDEDNYIRGW